MLGVPFVWLILKRNLFMPKGQFNYNRAIIRTTHWSLTSYRPGEKLVEQGNILRSFGIAIKTLKYFKEAIAVQEKGVSMVSDASPKVIDLETV
jgi:hypothetical protein